jgi:Single-strand binding protein family
MLTNLPRTIGRSATLARVLDPLPTQCSPGT